MENPTETEVLGPQDVARAAQLLRAGELVAMPTETVYGLAGDARNPESVAAIFAAKGRPAHNPLIVHLDSLDAAERFAALPAPAHKLAQAFWPGALTLVAPLRHGHGLAQAVTAGLPTVALRVPAHPLARALLAEFGGPVAAPSANPSGRISPTTAAHVMAGLAGRIAAVLDGGPCPVGVESTILGFEDETPVLLREGGISAERIATVLGDAPRAHSGAGISAPGQMLSHYAPSAQVRLDVSTPRDDEIWIGFGPDCADAALSLSPSGNLEEAATTLFATLHQADAMGRPIAIAPVPRSGIGAAINDRLRRAAAPRD
ncbi:MAG: threonylcarbamoyl-AMP synthase [Alphaproteobacteria bacterium]|jgi:L-threonylcarbamoyladenylate synthase|nr:threonylcarbamoyl-AMP synthase [Alphaproteobacteria bacterium]